MTNSIHAWLYAKYQETLKILKNYESHSVSCRQRLKECSGSNMHDEYACTRDYYTVKLRVFRKKINEHSSTLKYLKQEIRKHSK